MKQSFFKKRRESGQSLVELAITLPLVLLLICGMLEMGWLASTRQVMDTITREATRSGAGCGWHCRSDASRDAAVRRCGR